MRTGGSNYITINGSMNSPAVGTYHLNREKVTEDLQDMFEHGQRKIALLLWYGPMNFPAAHDNLFHHVVNSYGGVLCEQHQQNIVELLALISSIGYTALHFRFGGQGKAAVGAWTEWSAAQCQENINFILAVTRLINDNKGSLDVVFDLGVEQASDDWSTNQFRRWFCMNTWNAYCKEGFDPWQSCGFSILHGGAGLRSFLVRIRQAGVAFPGVYCADSYGWEYQTLTGIYKALGDYGQDAKPVMLQETYYNDAQTCADVKRAMIDAPNLNFGGIFQWPKMRDVEPFPYVYCKRYDNYLVDV